MLRSLRGPMAELSESNPAATAEQGIDLEIRREIQLLEQARVAMLFFFFALLAVLALVRRLLGCEVMQGTALVVRLALLGAAIFFCAYTMQVVNRANNADHPLKPRYWSMTAIFELLVTLAMVVTADLLSPGDVIENLSAPIMLLLPVLVILSIVRLRPTQTLLIGLFAGLAHAGFSIFMFMRLKAPVSGLPTVLTYSVLMVMSGFAGSFVSGELLKIVRGAKRERMRDAGTTGN